MGVPGADRLLECAAVDGQEPGSRSRAGGAGALRIPGVRDWAVPRAGDLWVQASLEQRQRFRQLFFPDGIAFDGNRFIGTGATAPAFSYLREIGTGNEGLVDQNIASWNRIAGWLRQLDLVRLPA